MIYEVIMRTSTDFVDDNSYGLGRILRCCRYNVITSAIPKILK